MIEYEVRAGWSIPTVVIDPLDYGVASTEGAQRLGRHRRVVGIAVV